MENLMVLAGLLMGVRGYWVFNLIRMEKGESTKSFLNFLQERSLIGYCIIIRPFFRKKKNESLRKRINIITFAIYVSLIVTIYYAVTKY